MFPPPHSQIGPGPLTSLFLHGWLRALPCHLFPKGLSPAPSPECCIRAGPCHLVPMGPGHAPSHCAAVWRPSHVLWALVGARLSSFPHTAGSGSGCPSSLLHVAEQSPTASVPGTGSGSLVRLDHGQTGHCPSSLPGKKGWARLL